MAGPAGTQRGGQQPTGLAVAPPPRPLGRSRGRGHRSLAGCGGGPAGTAPAPPRRGPRRPLRLPPPPRPAPRAGHGAGLRLRSRAAAGESGCRHGGGPGVGEEPDSKFYPAAQLQYELGFAVPFLWQHGRLWKSYLKRQNVGEPELKQWELWVGVFHEDFWDFLSPLSEESWRRDAQTLETSSVRPSILHWHWIVEATQPMKKRFVLSSVFGSCC
ncbi:uncharacterized protein POLR1D isoform 2-T2 [Chlamydotis macqueenii]